MIRSLENLIGYRIAATNGDLGTVEDFYFTDDNWRLHYIVVAIGGWLGRRHVLLAVDLIQGIADAKRELMVKISQAAVYSSPDIESDRSVSRQKEILLAEYFGWKPYWVPDPVLGVGLLTKRLEINAELPGANPYLRSFREVTSYGAQAPGLQRFVLDIIADDQSGQVLSLVTAAGRSPLDPRELLPVSQVDRIDWTNRLVHLKKGAAEAMDPFDPGAGINQCRTARFFDYLGNLHHRPLLVDDGEQQ